MSVFWPVFSTKHFNKLPEGQSPGFEKKIRFLKGIFPQRIVSVLYCIYSIYLASMMLSGMHCKKTLENTLIQYKNELKSIDTNYFVEINFDN